MTGPPTVLTAQHTDQFGEVRQESLVGELDGNDQYVRLSREDGSSWLVERADLRRLVDGEAA